MGDWAISETSGPELSGVMVSTLRYKENLHEKTIAWPLLVQGKIYVVVKCPHAAPFNGTK